MTDQVQHGHGKLLDGLKERNVKGTFFLIGENVKKAPELVKREAEGGTSDR